MKKVMFLISVFFMVFLFVSTDFAEPVSGDNFTKEKNEMMVESLKIAAEGGNVESQMNLGEIYYYGLGVKADPNEAAKWYLKAAEQGDVKSQSMLASMYMAGFGVKQDTGTGLKWLKKAAEQGDEISQFGLGIMHLLGSDDPKMPQDDKEAAKWFKKAAEKDFYPAMVKLAEMYSAGVGVDKDEKEAAKWREKAKKVEGNYTESQRALAKGDMSGAFKGWIKEAEAGDVAANSNLNMLKKMGHWDGKSKDQEFAVTGKMDPEEMRAALKYVSEGKYDEALKLYGKAAAKGDTIAKENVEWLKWKSKTLDEVLEAAENGDAGAQFDAGMRYWEKEDSKEAMKWFLKSMKQGFLLARGILRFMADGIVNLDKIVKISGYESNAEIARDPYGNPLNKVSDREEVKSEDKKNLLEAAENGDADAQSKLGIIYFHDENNPEEAIRWYLKAAEQGNVTAQVNLAASYFEGWGVERDLREAFKWYLKAAEQGNDIAEDRVGSMYASGAIGDPDYEEAKKWLEKAAAKGFAHSQYLLGRMYIRGDGVERDVKKGMVLVREAVEKGEIEASRYLLDSVSFSADAKLKSELFLLMAKAGFSEAQYAVGYMYYKGEGVEKNFDEAMKWFYAASYAGHEQSVKIINEFLASEEDGDTKALNDLVKNPFNALSEEELRLKFEKFKKDALSGNVKAQTALGTAYALGKGTERNLEEAAKWYKKAAENGDEAASELLSRLEEQQRKDTESNAGEPLKSTEKKSKNPKKFLIVLIALIALIALVVVSRNSKIKAKTQYSIGENYEKEHNFEEALNCYKKAAELGLPEAQHKLGSIYYSAKSFEEAFEWYKKAAEHDNAEAQAGLGLMYYNGEGVEKNIEEALKWLKKAAENGVVEAQSSLGDIYFNEEDGMQDYKEAFNWFYSAAQKNDAHAQYCLAGMYYNGTFVDKNYNDAFKWFLRAAERDNAAAQFELGRMFENGEGVEQNWGGALKWYRMAAKNGEERAAEKLKELGEAAAAHDEGIRTVEYSGSEQVPSAQEVLKTLVEAAENGDEFAKEILKSIEKKGFFESNDEEELYEDAEEPDSETEPEDAVTDEAVAKESEIVQEADETEKRGSLSDAVHKVTTEHSEDKTKKSAFAKWLLLFVMILTVAAFIFDFLQDYETDDSGEVTDAEDLFELGVKYYSGEGVRQNYEKAAEYFLKAAEQGKPLAQAFLGEMYLNGTGLAQDSKKAFKWYMKAAEQGVPESQYNVGIMYYNGEGVERDFNAAAEWYKKAADQGYASAQLNLGRMFLLGEGVPQNMLEAERLYKRSAAQGNENAKKSLKMLAEKLLELAETGEPHAQVLIAGNYMLGTGVEQSYDEALKWYMKAAEQGNADAKYVLGEIYECGEGVEKNYETAFKWFKEAAELGDKESQEILKDWDNVKEKRFAGCSLKKIMEFAEQGDAEALFAVGFKYFEGDYYDDIEVNYEEALKWLLKSADKGYAEAAFVIGNMYSSGQGVEKNYDDALNWWMKAVKTGYKDAAHNIGVLYFYGMGVEKNYETALKWFKEAAEQEMPKSQLFIGVMYFAGKEVERNYSEARKWLLKSASSGERYAQKLLGSMYYFGECGVAKNRKEALKWLKKAAEQDDDDAETVLESHGKAAPETMTDIVERIFKSPHF